MNERGSSVLAIKLAANAMLTICLLAGMALGVVAQDDTPAGATFVSGTLSGPASISEPVGHFVDGVLTYRDVERTGPIDMSDPRLTGSLVRLLNYTFHMAGSNAAAAVETGRWRVENDGGSWSGPSTAIGGSGDVPSDFTTALETVLLTGNGDYAGLSAYLVVDWSPETGADIKGVIFSGDMPPVPQGTTATE